MLQAINVSKIYNPKNGTTVKALDGVTISFAEKGMVFLLGKSGSGKSTLLNVCGGLDSPTSGEIVVKGRSSKDFSQSDFDSYRNTFVGFIFQEYNILNEFSVEDNIALALELQGKPKDKKVIAELLEQVDLTGFGKRKPNTLSGGQKQRIAIARALVKNPEIIMADEPTGALDSNTGRQVLETLKKLSRDKLVIVVSHDRDFAEQYGDRIIEMKDGKVLSDVSKTEEASTAVSENVRAIGSVLCVNDADKLNDKDFEQIKAFLKKTQGDVIIAGGEKEIESFKKTSRISENGREVFKDTTEPEKKSYTKEQSRFIRSKLPLKHAIKIGLSSLKNKPVRLFFTVILCTVAFIMFGLLSTMSFYDSEATFKQSLTDTAIGTLRLQKLYSVETTWYSDGEAENTYTQGVDTPFTEAEIEALKQTYGPSVFGSINVYTNFGVRSTPSKYWMNEIQSMAYLKEGHPLREKINGAYPKNKNEICISSYSADVIVNSGAYDAEGNTIDISSPDEIIGKKINISGVNYKVVGIFDSGVISEKYESLKTGETTNESLVFDLQQELSDGLHFVTFVSRDRIELIAKESQGYSPFDYSYKTAVATYKNKDGKYEFPEYSNVSYMEIKEVSPTAPKYFISANKTDIAENETLLPVGLFCEYVANKYNEKFETATSDYQYNKYNEAISLAYAIMEGGEWKHTDDGKGELVPYTAAQKTQKINKLLKMLRDDKINITLGLKAFDRDRNSVVGEIKELKVAGFYDAAAGNRGGEYKVALADSTASAMWNEQKQTLQYYEEHFTTYVAPADAIFGAAYLPLDKTPESIQGFWEVYNSEAYNEDGSKTYLASNFIYQLQMVDDLVEDSSKIFLYVGLVLALFAALLFSNFISVSISQKKREIGILRAVGARSADVFKIFFSESAFIAIICVVLASIGSVIGCNLLNSSLTGVIGASLFVFGVMSFLVLVGIAALTAIIATFLPVWNAARKKPVESIRAI
ncbi:MAG: ABC transporter ATP-binding protein/permease [Clostridia bacterium]|nr:ABC transporter ATP-binding protein/permease [Clostridia bacterium]